MCPDLIKRKHKALAAQERSQETRSFVRTVKAATRRRYTARRGGDPHHAGKLPPGDHDERSVPVGGDQAPLVLLVDQGVHGGRQGRGLPVRLCVTPPGREIQLLWRENQELKQTGRRATP